MGINILYSPSQNALYDECIRSVRMHEKDYERSILLVPETAKFDIEARYLENTGAAGMMRTEILSFSRFCHRIMEDTGFSNLQYIDETGQIMLLYKIINDNPGLFVNYCHLGKKPGFLTQILSVMGEMKRFLVSGEKLISVSESTKDAFLSRRLKETGNLMEIYDKTLGELGLTDSSENYTIAGNIIKKYEKMKKKPVWPYDRISWLSGCQIKITGFAGERNFTPQEFSLIEVLQNVCDVTVTAVCDKDSLHNNTSVSGEIFRSGKNTIEKIIRRHPSKIPTYVNYELRKSFSHIDSNLRIGSESTYKDESGDINFFEGGCVREELSLIAGEIKRLVREEKVRYKDITVLCTDPGEYIPVAKRVFRQAKIPFYSDEKKSLLNTGVGRLIESVMNIILRNWSVETVMEYLRCSLTGLSENETDEFENFLLKKGITGKSGLMKNILYEKENNTHLIRFRDKAFRHVTEYEKKAKRAKTAKDHCEALSDYIKNENLYEKIRHKTTELSQMNEEEASIALAKAWNQLLHLISQVEKIAGDTPLSYESAKDIIKKGMENSYSGTIPSLLDAVQVSGIGYFPAKKTKNLFLTGMSEEKFPPAIIHEGLLKDNDREFLSGALNIEIPSLAADKIYEDNFLIYSLFTLPQNKIYFSFSGKEKSGAVYRIENMFENSKKTVFRKTPGPMDIQVFGKEEALRYAAWNRKNNENSGDWKATEKILSEDGIYSDKSDTINGFTRKSIEETAISPELVEKTYKSPVLMSISQIEKYQKCAYSHLMQYLIKARPREIWSVTESDTGILLHGIAQYCMECFIRDIKSAKTESDITGIVKEYEEKDFSKFVRENLKNIADQVNEENIFEKGIYSDKGIKTEKIASDTLKAVFSQISTEGFIPVITEWAFSKNTHTSLTIKKEGLPEVHIEGKADRVDEKCEFFRVIDYKSSDKRIDYNDIHSGLSVQLLTYIMAYKKENPDKIPADAAYVRFTRPLISYENIPYVQIAKENKNKIQNEFRIRGMGMDSETIKIASEHTMKIIEDSVKNILMGKFNVNPKSSDKTRLPCDYCDYNNACGFEKNTDRPNIVTPLNLKKPGENKKKSSREIFTEILNKDSREEKT